MAVFPKYGIRVGPFRLNESYYKRFIQKFGDSENSSVNKTEIFKALIDNKEIKINAPLSETDPGDGPDFSPKEKWWGLWPTETAL